MKKSNEWQLLTCWIVLILATMATVYWGTQKINLPMQTAAILGIAVIKAGVIIDSFMELRHASLHWRTLMYGWPIAMSLAIATTLFL